MPQIRAFPAIRYSSRRYPDISPVIAPPYDVLDEPGRAALQARHPHNIVNLDLPWMPPKSVGPLEVYEKANMTLHAWISAGILERDRRPAIYAYAQNYKWGNRTFHRHGFFALVKLSDFDQGEVVPHEKTYAGPIEDRLRLMRATQMQLSPIFGVFSDPRHEINTAMFRDIGRPDQSGRLDGVQNDLWVVTEGDTINRVTDFLRHRPIYIADGHHRYTTALHYQKEQQEIAGGKLPPAHPSNWCMFILVGMQDDGLLILPTHRLIGGLSGFDISILRRELGSQWEIAEAPAGREKFDDLATTPHTFGLYDGATSKMYLLQLKDVDILKPLEPDHSDAWRRLDVAILQRYLLDEVLQPTFSHGRELTRGYTAHPEEIPQKVDGRQYQIALLLNPTPLSALEALGRHREVMPQKSTFFYPKIATGMVIHDMRGE